VAETQRTLTITVDEVVYEGLHRVIAAQHQPLSDRARRAARGALRARRGYRAMAAGEAREREAKEWAEGLILDLDDEAR
jgi:hypothetical protein